jgi:hypothetical protein
MLELELGDELVTVDVVVKGPREVSYALRIIQHAVGILKVRGESPCVEDLVLLRVARLPTVCRVEYPLQTFGTGASGASLNVVLIQRVFCRAPPKSFVADVNTCRTLPWGSPSGELAWTLPLFRKKTSGGVTYR